MKSRNLRVTHGIAELRPNETAAILMARAKAERRRRRAQKQPKQLHQSG